MKTNLVLAAVGLAGALASPALANITVSSKIDTEGGLLGNIIALALETMGRPARGLYDGSWSEWGADPARAVATGS